MTMNSNDRRALEDAQEAAALRDAIEKRNDREVSRMLSIGVDPNLSVDGCSMLQLALSHSLMDIARLLLEAGADADVPVAKGEGMTLLMVVAASGMLDAARMLIEFRPNPNCTSCNGWTALHYAANSWCSSSSPAKRTSTCRTTRGTRPSTLQRSKATRQ